MRTSCLFLYLLILFIPPAASASLDASHVPARASTQQDSLHLEAYQARLSRDWERAAQLHAETLASFPGDDATLSAIVRCEKARHQLPEFVARVESGEWDRVPDGTPLSAADREFVLGIARYIQCRFGSAKQHFDNALAVRPQWPRASFYLGMTERHLLLPRDHWEPHLQAAIDSPETFVFALSHLCQNSDRGAFGDLVDEARAALERNRHLPGVASLLDGLRVTDRLTAGEPSLDLCDSLWVDYRERHGVCVYSLADDFGSCASMYLPPRDALEFFSRRTAEDADPTRWLEYHADLLDWLGFSMRADSLLLTTERLSSTELVQLVRRAPEQRPALETLDLAHALAERTLWSSAAKVAMDALRELGREQEVASLRETVRSENPLAILRWRLNRLQREDANSAQELLDSLKTASADVTFFTSTEWYLSELRGDRVTTEELFRDQPHTLAMYRATKAGEAAFAMGDWRRGEELFRLVMEGIPDSFAGLVRLLSTSLDGRREDLTWDILERAEELYPGCPMMVSQRVFAHLAFGETTAAREVLLRAADQEGLPPPTAEMLAVAARRLGENAVAAELQRTARDACPRCPLVRFGDAWMHVQSGEMEEAIALLRPLVDEYPGREEYRSLLMSAGGGVETLSEYTAPEEGDRFSGFDHDLAATEWILARKVDPDTTNGAEAVHLFRSRSFSIESTNRYDWRQRSITQILKETGVETFQTVRIPFDPANGVPRIIVARVIRPDGETIDVPRSDILVTASQEEGVDVSDLRHLLVPFPGLRVGDVLDLVYERQYESGLSQGWSFRHLFAGPLQVRESVMELRMRQGLPVSIYRGCWTGEETHATRESVEIYRWVLEDLAPQERHELGPDPYDQYAWIGCTGYPSWSDVGAAYAAVFWERTRVSEEIVDLAAELTRKVRGKKDKAQAIYSYVVEEVNGLAIELGRGRLVPTPAEEVRRRGYGDCKDKVALLAALLDAADVEVQAALVSVRPGTTVRRDFPEVGCFSHVIAYLPDVDGGTFCDPTLGGGDLADLPVSVTGGLALVIPRERESVLAGIPAAESQDHGFELEVDLRPTDGNTADIRVVGTYRGKLAVDAIRVIAMVDSAEVGWLVARLLGYGLWNTCELVSWHSEQNENGELTLAATYRDSIWALGRASTLSLNYATEVSDPLIEYPAADGRPTDVLLPFPFRNRAVLRFHDGVGWQASDKIAQMAVEGPFYEGRISCKERKEDGNRYVEIRQEFEVQEMEIPIEAYREFRKEWHRFLVGVFQNYHFARVLDEDRIKELERHVSDHPEDAWFALQAVEQVLGSDIGGDGEAGSRRRAVAARMLAPFLTREDFGSRPLLMMAVIEAREGHYFVADSLSDLAIDRDDSEPFALLLGITCKHELRDLDGEIALLRRLAAQNADQEYQLDLAAALYAADRDAEARVIENRLYLLNRDADSTRVLFGRLRGYLRGERYALAEQALESLRAQVSAEEIDHLEVELLLDTDRFAQAVERLEEIWATSPIDAAVCRDLALAYAMSGQKLDQAEDLANSAIILSDDSAEARRTLGMIYARQERWKDARKIFRELLEGDDRPENRIVSSHFLALCHYQLGHEEDAVGMWEEALAIEGPTRWERAIRRSLELAAQEGSLIEAVFVADAGRLGDADDPGLEQAGAEPEVAWVGDTDVDLPRVGGTDSTGRVAAPSRVEVESLDSVR